MAIESITLCGKQVSELTKSSERKVRLICDDCGKESITNFHNYRIRQEKTRFPGKTFCRACSNRRSVKYRDISNLGRKPLPLDKLKINTFITSDGYKTVLVPTDTKRRGWSCYKKEHKIVMETSLGRSLTKQERIHHVDLDKLNNNLNNLYLCSNESHHRQLHKQLDKIVSSLIKDGIISFNHKTGEYERSKRD